MKNLLLIWVSTQYYKGAVARLLLKWTSGMALLGCQRETNSKTEIRPLASHRKANTTIICYASATTHRQLD